MTYSVFVLELDMGDFFMYNYRRNEILRKECGNDRK